MATRRLRSQRDRDRDRDRNILLDQLLDEQDAGNAKFNKALVNEPRPQTPLQDHEPVHKHVQPRCLDEDQRAHPGDEGQARDVRLNHRTATTILSPENCKDTSIHFDMDVSDDIGALLEEFSRRKRLGHFQAAGEYFEENLRDFVDILPVCLEYADMLVEQGAYQQLQAFLRPYREELDRRGVRPGASQQELYLALYMTNLQLIEALVCLHTTGDREVLEERIAIIESCMPSLLSYRPASLTSLDSAEVQIFRYALRTLGRLEKESDMVAESAFDYWANCEHFYRPLITSGHVWDARDLICALIKSEGAANAWTIIFGMEIRAPTAFTQLLGDWNMGQYDESTYLAVLDILVHASNSWSSFTFRDPSQEDLSAAQRCLDYARSVATCLKENNPDLVHCRSYLCWVLAEAQLRRKRKPAGSDLLAHLSTYPGLTVRTTTLPVYLPVKSENPTWYPLSGFQHHTSPDNELLEAAAETAKARQDYRTEVACLTELIYQSTGGPEMQRQRFSRMYAIQFRIQGELLNYQNTCLTRYLISTTEPELRALLSELKALHALNPSESQFTITLTEWCTCLMEAALLNSLTSGGAPGSHHSRLSRIDPSPESALPQYIKDQLSSQNLAQSYGLDTDELNFYSRRRTYRYRYPAHVHSSSHGHRPQTRRVRERKASYERVPPTVYTIPSTEPSGHMARQDHHVHHAIVPYASETKDDKRGHSQVDSEVRRERVERPQRPEEPNLDNEDTPIQPPTRRSTVQIASGSESEEGEY